MFSDRTNWNLEPNRLSEALTRHRAAGKPLLDLTVSNPTQCGFDYDVDAILRALRNPAAFVYEPDPRGLITARQAVVEYYNSRGQTISVDDIILTTSTSEAYSFIFRALCNPGDELLIPRPSYPLLGFLADILDVRLAPYPLFYDHGWQIDFHALQSAITPRTRGIIVVHPNNPTGHFTRREEAARLNDICARRQIPIIADEVFLDFSLVTEPPVSFAGGTAAPTFALSGLSKICGLPQMKIAWLVASGPAPWKVDALARLEVIADTFLSMNAPVQLATPVLLDQRQRFSGQLLRRVRGNLLEVERQLATQKSCARLQVEGGWNAVLRVPATQSDEEFALRLLHEKSVYLHPGHFYDFPGDGYLVVSLITPEADFAEGVSRLLSLCGS